VPGRKFGRRRVKTRRAALSPFGAPGRQTRARLEEETE
jgi:hypothetical protein